jgi:hypothetical protein
VSLFRTILTAFIALCTAFIAIKADAFVELKQAQIKAQLAEIEFNKKSRATEAAQFRTVILSQKMLATTIETLQARQHTFELQIKTLEQNETTDKQRNAMKDAWIKKYMSNTLKVK